MLTNQCGGAAPSSSPFWPGVRRGRSGKAVDQPIGTSASTSPIKDWATIRSLHAHSSSSSTPTAIVDRRQAHHPLSAPGFPSHLSAHLSLFSLFSFLLAHRCTGTQSEPASSALINHRHLTEYTNPVSPQEPLALFRRHAASPPLRCCSSHWAKSSPPVPFNASYHSFANDPLNT